MRGANKVIIEPRLIILVDEGLGPLVRLRLVKMVAPMHKSIRTLMDFTPTPNTHNASSHLRCREGQHYK